MAATSATGGLVPLGRGPVATVYAGTDERTGAPAVIKLFPAPLDRATSAALEREQTTLGTLRHLPSILQVIEVRQLPDGRPSLHSPRCSQSLADLIEQGGRLSVDHALSIGEMVATALVAAHGAGILHGGLTPHNVLFRSSGEPVVADFGVALRQRFARDPSSEVDYIAPETLRAGTLDAQTDLYGLGGVLHLALAGTSPHPAKLGEQPGERILRVLGEPVPELAKADVSDRLSALVASLLAKDPARRTRDAATVAEQLGALRQQAGADDSFDDFAGNPVPPPALPVAPVAPVAQPTPQPDRRLRYGIGAAGLAVAAGLVAWLAFAREETPRPLTRIALPPPVPAAPRVVQLELDPPADHGEYVDLTWRSSTDLEFAIVVASAGLDKPNVVLAKRNRTMRIAVEPGRTYCFQIQGADSAGVYESQPKPIRGATCRQ